MRESVVLGRMSGSGRRHSSKWDLKEEYRVHENLLPGKGGLPFHDKESQRGWLPPEAAGGTRLKWSILEPLPGRRGSHRDDSIDEDHNRSSKAVTTWDGDESYGTRMSPGFNDWRQQNHHSSPRNEWKRSRRSRTRSQSRSRSRSPARGIGRDSGLYDRSRSRAGASAQLCKDFAVGRCRKGNFCPFLHQSTQSYDDVSERPRTTKTSKYLAPYDSREYAAASGRSADCCTDFLKGNCRRGASCRFPHHSASHAVGKGSSNEVNRERNDRRHRDTSLERRGDREPRRAADVPCKFFAAGNCRNGKSCRFFHQDQAQYSPERPREVRSSLDQHSDNPEKFWNGPKWGATCTSDGAKFRKDVTVGASDERGIARSADGWRRWEDKAPEGPLADPKMVESEKALLWKTENTGDDVVASDQAASKNWLGDTDMSPEWDYKVQPSDHVDKQEHAGLSNCNPGTTPEASGQVHDVIAAIPFMMNETSTELREYNLTEVGACALPQHDKTATRKAASSHGSTPADILPAESFKQNGPNANAFSLPALNAFGQGPVTIPISGSGINPLNQTVVKDGKIISKPEIEGTNAPKGTSGLPMAQKLVSSEQLNQLTNISASLAQLLANGQQLPQLYAVHNSLAHSNTEISYSTNSEGLVKSQPAVTILSSQHVGLEQQYDPLSDSMDAKQHDTNNNPPGFSPNLIKQKNSVEGKPERSIKSLSPSASPNGTDHRKSLSLQESNGKNCQLNETEPGANLEAKKQTDEVVMEENRKVAEENAEEDGAVENIDGDGKIDEGKRNKDVKGVRAFKFALVEFVKELLKPTWKEGQMSKDAYKNIVKKVVDKVTGTMQGANMPQTQEKIQQYLSFSKPKLTKLVQAYVEKFQKDK